MEMIKESGTSASCPKAEVITGIPIKDILENDAENPPIQAARASRPKTLRTI